MFDVFRCSYTTDAAAGNVRTSCNLAADGMLWKTVMYPEATHTNNFDASVRDSHNARLAYSSNCNGTTYTPTIIPPLFRNTLNSVRGTFSLEITNAGNSKSGKGYFYFGPAGDFDAIPVEVTMYLSNVGNATNDEKCTYVAIPGFPGSYVAEVTEVVVHHAGGAAPTSYQMQLWVENVNSSYTTYDGSTYSVYKVDRIDETTQYKFIDADPFTIRDTTGNPYIYGGIKCTGATTTDDYLIRLKLKLLGIVE